MAQGWALINCFYETNPFGNVELASDGYIAQERFAILEREQQRKEQPL